MWIWWFLGSLCIQLKQHVVRHLVYAFICSIPMWLVTDWLRYTLSTVRVWGPYLYFLRWISLIFQVPVHSFYELALLLFSLTHDNASIRIMKFFYICVYSKKYQTALSKTLFITLTRSSTYKFWWQLMVIIFRHFFCSFWGLSCQVDCKFNLIGRNQFAMGSWGGYILASSFQEICSDA